MLYIIIAIIIWASSFTAGKYAYQMFDPAMAIQLRFIIASLIVLPLFLRTHRTIDKSTHNKLWAIAFLMFPIGILMQFMGLSYTSASSAVVVIGTEPMLVLLMGFFLFKEKIAWYDWLLSVVVLIGILLLVAGSQDDAAVDLFGLLLVFLAGAGFAFSIHTSKAVMATMDNRTYTAALLVKGSILALPISLFLIKDWQPDFSWLGLLSVIYLGVGCSWLAYKLWNIGLNKTPAHISGMLIALEPVVGVLIAYLFLGERMNALTAIGSLLILGSAFLSTTIPIIKQRKAT